MASHHHEDDYEFECSKNHPMATTMEGEDEDRYGNENTCCSICLSSSKDTSKNESVICMTCGFSVCPECCQKAVAKEDEKTMDATTTESSGSVNKTLVFQDVQSICTKANELLAKAAAAASTTSTSTTDATNTATTTNATTEFQHAMTLLEQALQARQAVLGTSHVAVAQVHHSMAKALAAHRHYPAALDHYQAASTIYSASRESSAETKEEIKRESTQLMDVMVEAANYYMMQGMEWQARQCPRDALLQFEYSHALLASVLHHSATAEAMAEETKLNGLAFSDVCRVLASIHVSLVDYPAALPILQHAHLTLVHLLGPEDPRTVAMAQDRDTVQTLVDQTTKQRQRHNDNATTATMDISQTSSTMDVSSAIPHWFERDEYKQKSTTSDTTTTDTSGKTDETASTTGMMGMRIQFLKYDFWDQVLKAGLNQNATLQQVMDQVVIPSLKDSTKAYVETLPACHTQPQATVMVSCAKETTVADIINTLDDYCREHDQSDQSVYVWIRELCDASSGNKNDDTTTNKDQEQERMAKIGHVMAILTPWYDPMIWKQPLCLADVYGAHQTPGCKVTLVLPPLQTIAVADALVGDPTGPMADLYHALDELSMTTTPAAAADDEKKDDHSNNNKQMHQKLQEIFRPWICNVLKEQVQEHCNNTHSITAAATTTPSSDAASSNDNAALQQALGQDQHSPTAAGDAAMNVFKVQLCNKMGLLFWQYGEYKTALELLEDALAMTETMYGHQHESTATVYRNIANVLTDMGRYKLALDTYLKVLNIMEANLPEHHPKLAAIYTQLGNLYRITEKLDKAMEFHQRALTMQNKLQGSPNNLASADSYNDMGNVFFSKGDYDAALMDFRKALGIQQSILQTADPILATTHNNIGMVLKIKGQFDAAIQEYKAALAIQEEALGKDHAQAAMTCEHIAAVMRAQENLEGALEMAERAKAIYEADLGLYNPSTATALQNLGSIQNDIDHVEDALQSFRKARDIRASLYGPDHPSVGETLQSIGTILYEIGDLDEALDELRKAFDILEPHLGIEHPTTKELADTINAVLEA